MKGPWTDREIERFLALNRLKAKNIAKYGVSRSIPAIMAMRRKLKRLQELGAAPGELPQLLTVSNAFVETHTLVFIRRRAQEDLVPVRQFVRRSRYRKPHLVEAHKRNRLMP